MTFTYLLLQPHLLATASIPPSPSSYMGIPAVPPMQYVLFLLLALEYIAPFAKDAVNTFSSYQLFPYKCFLLDYKPHENKKHHFCLNRVSHLTFDTN